MRFLLRRNDNFIEDYNCGFKEIEFILPPDALS